MCFFTSCPPQRTTRTVLRCPDSADVWVPPFIRSHIPRSETWESSNRPSRIHPGELQHRAFVTRRRSALVTHVGCLASRWQTSVLPSELKAGPGHCAGRQNTWRQKSSSAKYGYMLILLIGSAICCSWTWRRGSTSCTSVVCLNLLRAITKLWTGGHWESSSMKWQLATLHSLQISPSRSMRRLYLGR